MPKNLTPDLVKQFYAEACLYYDVEVINKADSQLMALVASFLDAIGVVDKDDFLHNYSTTFGNVIYIPFSVGSGDLWNQVTILTHELSHVLQFKHSSAEFMLRYICNKSDRANYEAEAYSTDLELRVWNGETPDVAQSAQSLLSYGLGQHYVEFMTKYLEIRLDVYRQGGEINETAAYTKQWLLDHGVVPDGVTNG